ncbi:MAG: ATP-binding cassette domain-containing protein [Clostridia bacterium]|nr:ATP-binding cassette domain-containing protein [Clostridia bacterium]
MLEIRNLTKIYRDKGGTEITALDNVSLSFGETGLVFILGKSGCGKSTFLNCVGGLDTPTSGDIIVNGRSFADFTAADLDAYRNTFVGFVFQEYNVLPEFTVEENVALALELQNERQTKDRVAAILHEVDLAEYADRRPGTLSGGQKQRIAIARALVKDPEIIMADEPTGALDSSTGRQVLETLRALSSTRLVIVVSHDKDFAESFADRIIELKDGRVISDVIRVKEQAKPLDADENVELIGSDTLSIKSGAVLTEQDFADIRSFISSGLGSIIITKGEAETVSFKAANRIAEDSTYEAFIKTPADAPAEEGALPAADAAPEQSSKNQTETSSNKCSQGGTDSGFISSKLPFGKAVKIGMASVKGHPVRLAFTIILSLVAFVVFGLFSCIMTYDENTVAAKSYIAGDDSYFSIQKRSTITKHVTNTGTGSTYDTVTHDYTGFGEADAEALGVSVTDALWGCSCSPSLYNVTLNPEDAKLSYYSLSTYKALVVPEGNALRDRITGSYPQTSSEVCISSYTAQSLLRSSMTYAASYNESTGEAAYGTRTFESAEELIGETLETSIGDLTITGIIDTGTVPSRYDYMKTDEADYEDDLLLSRYLSNGLDESLFVTSSFVEEYQEDYAAGYTDADTCFNYMAQSFLMACSGDGTEITDPYNASWNEYLYYISPYSTESEYTLPVHISGGGRELEGDEAILTLDNVYDIAEAQAGGLSSDGNPEQYAAYYGSYDAANNYIPGAKAAMEGVLNGYYTYMTASEQDGQTVWGSATKAVSDEDMEGLMGIIEGYLKDYSVTFSLYSSDYPDTSYMQDLSVAGFILAGEAHLSSYTNVMYCSGDVFSTLGSYRHTDSVEIAGDCPDSPYTFMVVPLKKDTSWLKGLMSMMYHSDDPVYYVPSNYLYSSIRSVTDVINVLFYIFLAVGLVFAVFAGLLLFNFITVSITGKNKEIGILRALGAKGTDVFKIFFSESVFVSLICFVLSVIITACLAVYINSLLASMFYIFVKVVVFGAASVFMMLAITVVVAFLGTFFPVYIASKKKPVDSIRSL